MENHQRQIVLSLCKLALLIKFLLVYTLLIISSSLPLSIPSAEQWAVVLLVMIQTDT
jgi:hypothetical protein